MTPGGFSSFGELAENVAEAFADTENDAGTRPSSSSPSPSVPKTLTTSSSVLSNANRAIGFASLPPSLPRGFLGAHGLTFCFNDRNCKTEEAPEPEAMRGSESPNPSKEEEEEEEPVPVVSFSPPSPASKWVRKERRTDLRSASEPAELSLSSNWVFNLSPPSLTPSASLCFRYSSALFRFTLLSQSNPFPLLSSGSSAVSSVEDGRRASVSPSTSNPKTFASPGYRVRYSP
mmetsp:Transcript_36854/g.72470  ORF Transcript_36854/g.72470 Transcript_36854/m.72470 type:complete len:232 (-) Transcript_36854:756-1451(-)